MARGMPNSGASGAALVGDAGLPQRPLRRQRQVCPNVVIHRDGALQHRFGQFDRREFPVGQAVTGLVDGQLVEFHRSPSRGWGFR